MSYSRKNCYNKEIYLDIITLLDFLVDHYCILEEIVPTQYYEKNKTKITWSKREEIRS